MHYRASNRRLCDITFLSGLIVLAGCPDDGATTVTAGPAGTGDTTAATADATVASDVTPTTTPTDSGVDPDTGPGATTFEPSSTEPATTEPATTEPVATTTDTSGDTATTTTTTTTTTTSQGTDTSDTGSTSTGVMGECEPGEKQACPYSGPAETENVGVCVAGARTCDAEGTFGECEDEVLPAVDTCNGAGDEACDGGGDELCGKLQWKRTFGSGGQDGGRRIAFDGAGNLVLVGYASGSVLLGRGPLGSAGGTDLLVARYAPDGTHLWSKSFGDASNQADTYHALAVDSAGNILVGGEFDGKLDLGGGPLVAPHADTAFVARLAPDGSHVWSKQLGGAGSGGITTLSFDGAGNALLGGFFVVSIDLGGGVVNATDGTEAFVAKYGPDGAFKWGKVYGGALAQGTRGVVAKANGDVCVAGVFKGSIDLGLGVMPSAGDFDMFIGCLDPQGKALWAKTFGSSWIQQLNSLAIDAEDRLTFAGETGSIVDFGGGPLGEDKKWYAYVARLDGEGKHVWSSLVVPSTSVYVRDLAIDGFGSLVMVGDFHSPTDFGDGPIGSLDNPGIYVIKLDSAGKRIWHRELMGNFNVTGYGAAGSHDGRAAVAGDFQGKIDLGDGWISSYGVRDGMVAVFAQ